MRPFGKTPVEQVQDKLTHGDKKSVAASALSALVVLGGVAAASAVVSAIRSREEPG